MPGSSAGERVAAATGVWAQTVPETPIKTKTTASLNITNPLCFANTPSIATLVGYASALPTPFAGDDIDEAAFVALCHWQIEEGISALVVNGTTGEAPTLSDGEQSRLLRLAVTAANRRVPVIAGTGAPATAHAVALARAKCGADRERSSGGGRREQA